MTKVTDVEIFRDGGTLDFCVSSSAAEGSYRLQTPVKGVPEPLFKDGVQLGFGSTEERTVLSALEEWLAAVSTPDVVKALSELERPNRWFNLSERLSSVVPVY